MYTIEAEACLKLLGRLHSTLEEYEFLVKLLGYLKKTGSSNSRSGSSIHIKDEQLLEIQEIAAKFNISWSYQAPLDWFVFYLFVRRYEQEWATTKETAVQVITPNQNTPFRQSTLQIEEQFDLRIKRTLSDLISRLCTRPLSVQFLRTYVSTMKLAERTPRMRKHLVSHSLKWLTAALVSAPELQGRRGSRRASGGILQCPPAQLAFLCSHVPAVTAVTGGTAKEAEIKQPETESTSEEALTIAIEGLILASASDQRSGIRKLTVGRLATYLDNLPFASSLLYCDKFVRICRKTPDSLWHRQDGLLRLINHLLSNWTEKYDLTCMNSPASKKHSHENALDAAGEFLKRRVSTALVNAFTPPKISVTKATTPASSEPRELQPQPQQQQQTETTTKQMDAEDKRFLREELLPYLLQLSASLLLSKRPPVRHRAALIYVQAASFLPAEVQVNICEEVLQFLRKQLQEVSRKNSKVVFPSPDSEEHASIESLVSIAANLMPVLATHNAGCVASPDACYVITLLIAHPSAGIRKDACNLLTSIFTTVKDCQQEIRNIVACITQNWSPNQEILLAPMKNFVREANSRKAAAAVWTLGHLQAYYSICRLLVENDMQTEAACLLPNRDMRQLRKTYWSVSQDSQSPPSLYARRFTESSAPPNEKRRLSKEFFRLPSNPRLSLVPGVKFKRNRSPSSVSGMKENKSLIEKLSLLEKTETRLYVQRVLKGCSAGTSTPSSPTFFSSGSPSRTPSLNDGQNGSLYSPASAGPQSSLGGNSNLDWESDSLRSHEVMGAAGTRPISDFRSSLIIMLHASIECLCDPSKELAQLAHETLYTAGHVAGLFDRTLLPDLITTHFSFEPSLLTYGCLELLSFYVLQFAEAYATQSEGTGATHRGSASSSASASNPALLLSGTFNLERSRLWLRSCEHYIGTRSVSDCVTLDAVRTVLGVLASLPHLGHASVQLSLCGRHSTLTSIDDSEEDLETNACYLDVDANSLLDAISSVEKLVEHTGQSLRISKHPPLENEQLIGWLPDAPRQSSDDVLVFASQLLGAIVQALEGGVASCATSVDPNNLAGLSVRPRVAASDAETVALLLSPLLPILARWPIYLYRTQLHRSPAPDDIKGRDSRLHRRTITFLLKIIWTICGCLPKSEVIVAGSQTVFTPSPRRKSAPICADAEADSLREQPASIRVSAMALARADMVAVTEGYLSTLLEIISTVRSQTFPASIFTSPTWWWIGQLCAVVPHLCYTAPSIDTSSLIAILCAELEQNQNNRGGGGSYGASDPMNPRNATTRSRFNSTGHQGGDAVDAMFVRVRKGSVLPPTEPPKPEDRRDDQISQRKRLSEDLPRRQSKDGLEISALQAAILVKSLSEERDEEEEEEEEEAAEAAATEDTDFYTDDDDAETDQSEVASGKDISTATKHRLSVGVCRQKSTEDSQAEPIFNFEPISHAAIVKLVANLIKISDPGKIKPLKGQMPREVVETVKEILENSN